MGKSEPRAPALDGLRGAAALCVIHDHCVQQGFVPKVMPFSGVLGVTVFFTLSGFLMALLHAGQAFDKRMVWNYVVSRAARIAPLYLFAVLAAWIIHSFDSGFIFDINGRNIVRHLLFSGSERVFWSIPPEVQFYVFFLAVWFSIARAKTGKYLAGILTLAGIVGMIVVAPHLPGTTLPTKLPFFLSGAAAGLIAMKLRDARGSSLLQGAALLAVVLSAGYLYGIAAQEETVYHSALYAVLCAGMILALYLPSRLGNVLFGNQVMRKLGYLSFAIYLLHDPCLYWGRKIQTGLGLQDWTALLMGLALTALLTITAHYLIEKPARRKVKTIGAQILDTHQSRPSEDLSGYQIRDSLRVSAASSSSATVKPRSAASL